MFAQASGPHRPPYPAGLYDPSMGFSPWKARDRGKGGVPRHIGILMGSRRALDLAVCRMFGFFPAMVPTLKIADDMGFLPQDWHIDGPLPEIHDFRLPDMASL